MNFINKISGALDDAADSARSAVLKLLEPEVRHQTRSSVEFLALKICCSSAPTLFDGANIVKSANE
jgi:hypothetical protein